MFDVTPDEIASLNDEDLRTLVALLCEAEVSLKGFSRSAVTWGGSQTAPDGGLDVRVSLPPGSTIEGFIPRFSTGFQVKKPDMPRGEIIPEMRPSGAIRDVIQELADESGSYVIISSSGATSDIALRNRRNAMREASNDVANADQLHTDFYDRTRLASWVRSHPGLIAWVKEKAGRAVVGWQPFRNWSGGPDGEYILDDRLRLHFSAQKDAALTPEEGITKLRGMLSQPKKAVRLVGLSGVGKTRLIQALFDDRIGSGSLPSALAVYTNLSDDPDPQPIGLTTNLIGNRTRAVVIVDNCPLDLHRRLADLCQRSESSVSILTVEYDIRDDQPEGTEVVRLDTSSNELIEKLVRLRFPNVSEVDARTIAEVSGGNARIAIALAGTIEGTETIAGLTDEELFQRLFRQRRDPNDALLIAAQACSLVYSFNGEALSGDEAELPTLANLAEQSTRELFRHVSELRQRDLVQQRGDWRAVLPHAIANRLAASALQSIPRQEIEQQLINNGSERLARSFSRRLSYLHESEQAVSIVAGWLAPGGLLGDVASLNELEKSMFENVAPVQPEATLRALERVADDGDAIEVWNEHKRLIANLAYDPALFERCVTILMRIATSRLTNQEAKEAADLFTSLFHIHLSGTHATIEQRLSVLETLLRSQDAKAQDLGIEGMNAVLEATHFTSAREFDFGARSRDYGYSPRSYDELAHWYRSALSLIERLADNYSHLYERFRVLLAQKLRGLWTSALMYDEVELLYHKIAERRYWPEGWIACRTTLHFDRSEMPPEGSQRLMTLEQDLRPRNLLERVRANVLADRYGDFGLDDIELDSASSATDFQAASERADQFAIELGSAIATDNAALQELLPELVLGGSRVWYFARGLARNSSDLRGIWACAVSNFNQADASQRDLQMLGGLLAEIWERDESLANELLDWAFDEPTLVPFFPLLQMAVPIDERGVTRLKRTAGLEIIPARMYRSLGRARQSDSILGQDLKDIIVAISSKPDGFEVATEILSMRFFADQQDQREHDAELLDAGREILQHLTFRRNPHRDEYNLGRVIAACLSGPDGAPVAVEIVLRLKEAVARRETYAFYHDGLLEALCAAQSIAILDALFPPEVEDHEASIELVETHSEHRKHPLDVISPADLVSWCEQLTEPRFLLAASMVTLARRPQSPSPLEWTPQALALLAAAPDPRTILQTFIARFRPSGWSGSLASTMEQNMTLLDQLGSDLDPSLAELVNEAKVRLRKEIEERRLHETERERADNERFE